MVKNVFKLLLNKHSSSPDLFYCKAQEIAVTSPDEVFLQADGDVMGKLPAQLSVCKNALSVIVPKSRN
jgi:diacylglycerol kinase family enzyme